MTRSTNQQRLPSLSEAPFAPQAQQCSFSQTLLPPCRSQCWSRMLDSSVCYVRYVWRVLMAQAAEVRWLLPCCEYCGGGARGFSLCLTADGGLKNKDSLWGPRVNNAFALFGACRVSSCMYVASLRCAVRVQAGTKIASLPRARSGARTFTVPSQAPPNFEDCRATTPLHQYANRI